MNIHCMYCGHTIQLDDTYTDYRGPLRCSVCKSLMRVEVADGHLRAMDAMPVAGASPAAAAAAPATPATPSLTN